MKAVLGSLVFNVFMIASVPVYAALAFAAAPFGSRAVYGVCAQWADAVLGGLRVLCGIRYVVEGSEHLPAENAVVLMKHSSTWETLAQLQVFPRQTWVLKRELLWIPIFGWALAMLKPIAIDRNGGRAAVQQVLEQGRARLAEGLWVVIFPEGTRLPVGATRRYGISGALLAKSTGRRIVPVAHNAGELWPRRGWLKRPGTIRLVIGPAIDAHDADPRELNEAAQRWIEAKVGEITGRPAAALDSEDTQT